MAGELGFGDRSAFLWVFDVEGGDPNLMLGVGSPLRIAGDLKNAQTK